MGRIIFKLDAANISSKVTKPPATYITNVKADLSELGSLNAYINHQRAWKVES